MASYEPQINVTGSPMLNLIGAVFKQAVQDAEDGDRHAMKFLKDTGVVQEFARYLALPAKADKRRNPKKS